MILRTLTSFKAKIRRRTLANESRSCFKIPPDSTLTTNTTTSSSSKRNEANQPATKVMASDTSTSAEPWKATRSRGSKKESYTRPTYTLRRILRSRVLSVSGSTGSMTSSGTLKSISQTSSEWGLRRVRALESAKTRSGSRLSASASGAASSGICRGGPSGRVRISLCCRTSAR